VERAGAFRSCLGVTRYVVELLSVVGGVIHNIILCVILCSWSRSHLED
jgi:hypothetical protein